MFITLTNAGTEGSAVHIRADKISMIGMDNEGDTVVVYDGRTEFVRESPKTVLELVQQAKSKGKCGHCEERE